VSLQRLTRLTSASFRCRARRHGLLPGIRPVIPTATAWRSSQRRPVSRRLSATGICFLGVLFPPGTSAPLSVGPPPPPGWQPGGADPDGVPTLHMREIAGRVGCLLYPGGGGVPATVVPSPGRRLPRHSGQPLFTPVPRPDPGCVRNEASNEGSSRHPSGPSPCLWPPVGTGALGRSPDASHPTAARPRPRTSGWGRIMNTDPKLRLRHSSNLQSS
jgi:hypothetical protein